MKILCTELKASEAVFSFEESRFSSGPAYVRKTLFFLSNVPLDKKQVGNNNGSFVFYKAFFFLKNKHVVEQEPNY